MRIEISKAEAGILVRGLRELEHTDATPEDKTSAVNLIDYIETEVGA